MLYCPDSLVEYNGLSLYQKINQFLLYTPFNVFLGVRQGIFSPIPKIKVTECQDLSGPLKVLAFDASQDTSSTALEH
jgi:hypothetical protein